MAKNTEVEKNQNESTANLMRRFTKRVQNSGIIPKMRKGRYFKRPKSQNVRRNAKLLKLEKKVKYEKLVKLGKIPERPTRGGRGR